jgi:hypothetical protein
MYDLVKIIDYELCMVRLCYPTLTLLESSINITISIMKLMIELHSDNHTIPSVDKSDPSFLVGPRDLLEDTSILINFAGGH